MDDFPLIWMKKRMNPWKRRSGLVEVYIEEWNREQAEQIEIVDRYLDLGKTGSNFNRDEFQRLMQDIRLGDINCVVVKDLSRFGRNYLEAGNYIEKIFPFLGVRFIAVSDGIDTGTAEKSSDRMSVEIKNLVNDMYAKNFSVKAAQQLERRRQEGSYVGGLSPYGYKVVWEKRIRKLVPDEAAADIVRFIFQYYSEMENFTAVANELSRKRVNPPAVYHKTGKVFADFEDKNYKFWDESSIRRILQQEAYLGKLVQGKTSITGRDEKNRVPKSKEEWSICENAHEPLVDSEIFYRAAQIYERSRKGKSPYGSLSREYPLDKDIFDGIVFCGVCGRKMTRNSRVKIYADGSRARLEGYHCINSIQAGEKRCPESNRISMTKLSGILVELIRMEFAVCLKQPHKNIQVIENCLHETSLKFDKRMQEIEKKIVSLEMVERAKYIEYREGHIRQENYRDFMERQEKERKRFREEYDKYAAKKAGLAITLQKCKATAKAALHIKKGSELSRELVETLISRIHVYPRKRIEVLFQFTDEEMNDMMSGKWSSGASGKDGGAVHGYIGNISKAFNG